MTIQQIMTQTNQSPPLEPELLDGVLERIGQLAKSARVGGYIFRGEPKCYALVSSSLRREFPDIANQHFHLDTVQDEMLEAAKHFVGDCDKEELLSKLQHFGYSTNLIDFTTDFLIALFFACDGHVAHDGRVVLLRRSDYPTFKPKHPDNRVIAQKSVFVTPHDGVVEPSDVVVIPRELKDAILAYLNACHGISTETVYNDLHGFMRHHKVHRSAYAEFYAGITFQLKGDGAKAIEHYDEAIGRNPRLTMAFNNRGTVKMAMGDHVAAISDFSRVIEANPLDASALSNRGIAYRHLGDETRAMQDWDRATSVDPKRADAFVNRANLHNARSDHDLAINDYDKALAIEPNSAFGLSSRGTAYSARGDHARAIRDHDQAVALAPQVAPIRGNRGKAHWHAGDYQSAIRDFTTAIELDPDADYFNGRGSALLRQTDAPRAMQEFDRAIALNPRAAIAYHNRGLTRCALRDPEGALRDLATARSLGFHTSREFRNEFGSVAAFEQEYDITLDPRVAALLTE